MNKIAEKFNIADLEIVPCVAMAILLSGIRPVSSLQVYGCCLILVEGSGTFSAIFGLEWIVVLLAGEVGSFV